MALRKALAYSKKKARPFTRHSRRKDKSYIKTIPHNRIVKYNTGDQKGFEQGKHTHIIQLVAEEEVQVRDNALEAGRMLLTKVMDEKALGEYFLIIKVHPHHFLRENKSAAAVAGADRISTGMTQSYGVVIGRAAMVHTKQPIFSISCASEKVAHIAKEAMYAVKAKVPCRSRVVFEKN